MPFDTIAMIGAVAKIPGLFVAIFFLEVREAVRFLETAAIMETMSSLMAVLLPPKEPEPFAEILTYLSAAKFMND